MTSERVDPPRRLRQYFKRLRTAGLAGGPVDPRWRVQQANALWHTARLVNAPRDFRFLCGACLRKEHRKVECYIKYPFPLEGDGVRARAVEHTFRVPCPRRRCAALYVADYDKVKARVRSALDAGRRELVLGEDL